MLSAYIPQGGALDRLIIPGDGAIPPTAVWIDLIDPTPAEDILVEKFVGIAVPTREEMREIEISSRLYIENGARYMTATLMYKADTEQPKTTDVTFILSDHRLITVRYDEPMPFTLVTNKLCRTCGPAVSGESVMMDLLEAVIDRAADILERIGVDIDKVSHDVFEPEGAQQSRAYQTIFRSIGRRGDITSKVRESLLSVGRVTLFLAHEVDGARWDKEMRAQLKTMQRDVSSLSDHATYLTNKITFLLDAMIGVVSLEQNNIIKLFSVAAVVFMPPTLVASIYGMNFEGMPELRWHLGYPFALALMVVAAIVPYLFFKWRKWL